MSSHFSTPVRIPRKKRICKYASKSHPSTTPLELTNHTLNNLSPTKHSPTPDMTSPLAMPTLVVREVTMEHVRKVNQVVEILNEIHKDLREMSQRWRRYKDMLY